VSGVSGFTDPLAMYMDSGGQPSPLGLMGGMISESEPFRFWQDLKGSIGDFAGL